MSGRTQQNCRDRKNKQAMFWSGFIKWFNDTLVTAGAIAPDDLALFRIIDDIESIPGLIRHYHAVDKDSAGFKIPRESDRRRALGLE